MLVVPTALALSAWMFALPRSDADELIATPAERTAPDPVYFEDRVQPVLVSRCAFAGCHNGPGAGRLILQRPILPSG